MSVVYMDEVCTVVTPKVSLSLYRCCVLKLRFLSYFN